MGTGCRPAPSVEIRDEASLETAAATIPRVLGDGASTLGAATGNEKPSHATTSGAKDLSRPRNDAMPDLDCNIGAGSRPGRPGQTGVFRPEITILNAWVPKQYGNTGAGRPNVGILARRGREPV